MLNGKFFTGLPPKMMDRVGAGKNRQESHMFWPDESKTDTAVESRLKRRTSLQYEQQQKPNVQRTASVDQPDVDTRRMFNKEFAKSSIQFYDNIDEQTEAPRPMLRSKLYTRKEIAPKPTATRHALPESVIDEDYTNAKKQQAYSSKIEFYDYADEGLNNRPRMDINDKRNVERNTKNSPKLQNKKNVKNLKADEAPVTELKFRNDFAEVVGSDKSENYIKPRPVEPKREVTFRRNSNTYDANDAVYNEHDVPPVRRRSSARIQNITRDNIKRNSKNLPEYFEYYTPVDESADIHEIEINMKNAELQPRRILPIKKHVTYQHDYLDDAGLHFDPYHRHYHEEHAAPRVRSPNMRPGSQQRPAQTQQRQHNAPVYDVEGYQYIETRQSPNNYNSAIAKPNNNNNVIHNDSNQQSKHTNAMQAPRKILPKISTPPATSTTMDLEPPESAADSQQHLRSNIFFMDAPRSAAVTPTPNYRRNARSSAVQRVSVGLPD